MTAMNWQGEKGKEEGDAKLLFSRLLLSSIVLIEALSFVGRGISLTSRMMPAAYFNRCCSNTWMPYSLVHNQRI
jgi:hypothetical protein